MNRIVLLLIMFSCTAPAFGQDQTAVAPAAPVDPVEAALAGLDAGDVSAAQQHLGAIADPVAQLYIVARWEQAKGDAKRAIQTVARIISEYSHKEEWIAKSELLSAELYVELGLLDAAAVTVRHVQLLHGGTDEAKQAAELSVKIEELKKELESEGSTE